MLGVDSSCKSAHNLSKQHCTDFLGLAICYSVFSMHALTGNLNIASVNYNAHSEHATPQLAKRE